MSLITYKTGMNAPRVISFRKAKQADWKLSIWMQFADGEVVAIDDVLRKMTADDVIEHLKERLNKYDKPVDIRVRATT